MDPVDKAFYDLTVAQRNAAWYEVEKLKSRVAALEGHLAKYRAATETVLNRYDLVTHEYWAYGGHEETSHEPVDVADEIERERWIDE